MKKNALLASIGIVTLLSIAGKLSGFIREVFIAGTFGASAVTDVYFLASVLPILLYASFGLAVQSGLMPLYMEKRTENEKDASEFMSTMYTFFFLFGIVVVIFTVVIMPYVASLIAPGFSQEEQDLVSKLGMIMAPSFLFYLLSGFSEGVLQSHKRFALPAGQALANNLVMITLMFLLAKPLGVYGLSIAMVGGVAFQYIIQHHKVKSYNIGFRFQFNREHWKTIKTIFISLLPVIIAAVMVQLNQLVDRMVGSTLETGSVSAVNYANRLMFLPLSIIIMAVVNVFYPYIVEKVKTTEGPLSQIKRGSDFIWYLSMPIMVVMVLESHNLISIAFARGAFTEEDVIQTSAVFLVYSFALVFVAMKDYYLKVLVAVDKKMHAMWVSIGCIALNIVLSILLARAFGAPGIAFATGIAMMVQTVLSRYIVYRSFSAQVIWPLLFGASSYYVGHLTLGYMKGIHPILSIVVTTLVVFSVYLAFFVGRKMILKRMKP